MKISGLMLALALVSPAAVFAQPTTPAPAEAAAPMDEESLGAQRGGVATPMGVDIGFGATVRTYVDGSIALETRMTLASDGIRTERVFENAAAAGLTGEINSSLASPVTIAPGTQVIHDLSENRIASVIMNTANDRTIRQDTDLTLHLPQLPDLQQRIGVERLTNALQSLSPDATGLAR